MWGNLKMRLGDFEASSKVGHYSAQAGAEAAQLVQALGGKPESMSAGSPAWTAIYASEGLAGSLRDYARKVVSASKKSGNLAKAAEKVVRQLADQGIKLQTYYDLDAARRIAQKAGLDLPILREAHTALWGEAEAAS
jgi:hypothetical protein